MKTFMNVTMALIASLGFAVSTTNAATKKAPPTMQKFERPYGMAGCGLGSQVMGNDGSQVLASTTNGTSWNQVFGITSGTSNCVDGPMEEVAQKMDRFILVNKVALAADMARGEGENLNALSLIAGCKDSNLFNAEMQKHFHTIYQNENVPVTQVTDRVINVIQEQESLMNSCHLT